MPTEYSAQQLTSFPKTVFLHGVASGDPLTDRVIIWTRITSAEPDLPKEIKDDMVKVELIDTDGEGPDYDQWDGYPAERGRC